MGGKFPISGGVGVVDVGVVDAGSVLLLFVGGE